MGTSFGHRIESGNASHRDQGPLLSRALATADIASIDCIRVARVINVSAALNVALVGALVVFILYRQTIARPLTARGVWLLPVILIVVALVAISNVDHGNLSYTAVVYLAIDVVVSLALGALRGVFIRVFERDGAMWRQGTVVTVMLWVAAIGIRIVIGVFASNAGVGNVSVAGLELALAASLFGQNAVVALRGTRQGLTFATDASRHHHDRYRSRSRSE